MRECELLMCMYVYMYIYIYTCVYVCVVVDVYVCAAWQDQTAHMYVTVNTSRQKEIRTILPRVSMYTYTYTCMCMHAYVCTHEQAEGDPHHIT